jgi:High potential iron-sulfur protein/TAT (twin-arginine translocation) pathway signal sequence
MQHSRRDFLVSSAALAAALSTGQPIYAQGDKLDPNDATAKSLGYVTDATKADKAKYPKYAADQSCASCQLFTGKPGAAEGPCSIFANKIVPAKAWCSAYVKKA